MANIESNYTIDQANCITAVTCQNKFTNPPHQYGRPYRSNNQKCSAILCDEISVFRIGILISNVARSCSFRSFHVSFQSSLPRKPLLAFTTLKWFDTVMNIRDVLLKSSLLRETSLTFGTRKRFHTLMNCQDVPL